jgi:beta-1,4-N-acetylglucosaminyltransferase
VIFVTTGTNGEPFDRLISWVEQAAGGEPLVVQGGPSRLRPEGATWRDYVSFEELERLIREARVVVSHGGVGSILVTLLNGKRPLVVPRLAGRGEAVDDHQLHLARRLAREDIVVLVEHENGLREAVRRGSSLAGQKDRQDSASDLAVELAAYLDMATAGARNG